MFRTQFDVMVSCAMNEFKGSFINSRAELILNAETNLYMRLSYLSSETDFKRELLSRCSKDACKTELFRSSRKNTAYQDMVRENVNTILGTKFTRDDMGVIYTKIGHGSNEELAHDFVESGYDLSLLKE